MEDIFEQFFCKENSDYSVVVEVNGNVAYAYLLYRNDEIVSDVWLYNLVEAPKEIAMSGLLETAPLNSETYTKVESLLKINSPQDIKIEWKINTKSVSEVILYVGDNILAKMLPYSKPGWSVNALRDGPLAKKM